MNPLRALKDAVKRALHRRGYEIYRRPYLPHGVDPFESLRAAFPQWRPQVIFDVGANVGQTVRRLRPLFPAAQLHAFEPVPATFAELRAGTADLGGVLLHPLALADRNGETSIALQSRSVFNSLAPALNSAGPGAGSARLTLETLDSFCTRQAIVRIDLLKIDVEGFELSVLAGARTHLAAGAIDFILIEAGLMPGDPRFTPLPAIIDALRPHGFWLMGIFEQRGWKYFRGAEFCDALFALEKHLR